MKLKQPGSRSSIIRHALFILFVDMLCVAVVMSSGFLVSTYVVEYYQMGLMTDGEFLAALVAVTFTTAIISWVTSEFTTNVMFPECNPFVAEFRDLVSEIESGRSK